MSECKAEMNKEPEQLVHGNGLLGNEKSDSISGYFIVVEYNISHVL